MFKFYPIILFSLISSFAFAQQNVMIVETGTTPILSNFYFTSHKITGNLNQARTKYIGGSLYTAKLTKGAYVIKLNTNN